VWRKLKPESQQLHDCTSGSKKNINRKAFLLSESSASICKVFSYLFAQSGSRMAG
jgi:hypothetical protein